MKTKTAYKNNEGKKEILKAYESFLENWTSLHQELYIETRYGKTFVIASGEESAPPLILLHGTGMNSVMWIGEISKYSQNYRVYAIDIPGEPGKSDENQLPLSGTFYADWLKDVLDNLNIEETNIVGISLGAWLATKFSVNHPEMVNKLVLIAPSGIGPQKKSFLLIALFHALQGEKGIEKLYCKVNGNKPMPQAMMQYQKLIRRSFNYRQETIPLFSDKELKQLKMPIALFVGGKDIMLHSDKTAKRLGNLLPHANINFEQQAGHSIINASDRIMEFLEVKQ